MYEKTRSQPDSFDTTGFAHGSNTPIFVPPLDLLDYVVYLYLPEWGNPESEIAYLVECRPVWYGIIYGEHSDMAILWLVENRKDLKMFKWSAPDPEGRFTGERYCRLAIYRNHRHSQSLNIRFTFFEELDILRHEYERLSSDGSTPYNTRFTRSYLGTEHISRTKLC